MQLHRIEGITMTQLRLAALALAVFSLTSVAGAQVTPIYMTVDAVSVAPGAIAVTGVVQGQSTPTTRSATFAGGDTVSALEACHRMLLLALSKPGQYVADVRMNLCTVRLVAP
jgi:hypothetical protein